VNLASALPLLRRYAFLTVFGLVKYVPTPIGDVLRYLVLKPFMRRLDTLWIHEGVTIHHPENVAVGRRSSINEFVFINGYGGVEIGDWVAIGHRVSILSAEHGIAGTEVAPYLQAIERCPVRIEDEVYLGAGAVVLGNVTIGRGAVVGAGAVVTRDVAPYAIVAGVPARVLGHRKELA